MEKFGGEQFDNQSESPKEKLERVNAERVERAEINQKLFETATEGLQERMGRLQGGEKLDAHDLAYVAMAGSILQNLAVEGLSEEDPKNLRDILDKYGPDFQGVVVPLLEGAGNLSPENKEILKDYKKSESQKEFMARILRGRAEMTRRGVSSEEQSRWQGEETAKFNTKRRADMMDGMADKIEEDEADTAT